MMVDMAIKTVMAGTACFKIYAFFWIGIFDSIIPLTFSYIVFHMHSMLDYVIYIPNYRGPFLATAAGVSNHDRVKSLSPLLYR